MLEPARDAQRNRVTTDLSTRCRRWFNHQIVENVRHYVCQPDSEEIANQPWYQPPKTSTVSNL